MGFCIAIGGRSSSSQALPERIGNRDANERLVAIGVNHDSTLCATVTILYPGGNKLGSDQQGHFCQTADLEGTQNEADADGGDSEKRHSDDLDQKDEKLFMGEAPLLHDETAETFVELVLEVNSLRRGQANFSYNSSTPSRFRIPLISISKDKNSCCSMNAGSIDIEPMVSFSSDGRYLVCLIPPMISSGAKSSTAVVFTLRKSMVHPIQKQYVQLPLPPFIGEKANESNSNLDLNTMPPIPIDPRIVRIPSDSLDSIITTICDVLAPSGTSILLAACLDGSILAINYKRAKLAGILFHQKTTQTPDKSTSQQHTAMSSHIVSMNHFSPPCTNTSTLINTRSNQNIGRLTAIRADGSVIIYTSSFVSSNELDSMQRQSSLSSITATTLETDNHQINNFNNEQPSFSEKQHGKLKSLVMKILPLTTMEPAHQIPSNLRHAYWINFNTLVLTAGSNNALENSNVVAQVWIINNHGDINKISELKMNEERLDEEMHGVFEPQSREEPLKKILPTQYTNVTGVHFDPFSNCLAISGQINTRNKNNPKKAFVCIWNWASGVLGLTLASRHDTCSFSKAVFGYGGMSFFHYHVHENKRPLRMIRDVYKMGILCPPSTTKICSNANRNGGWVEEASPLFLCDHYLAVPFVSKSKSSVDTTLEWKEFLIPSSYADEYGPAVIAAVGRKVGRSAAVASSRGLCILDMHRMRKGTDDIGMENNSAMINKNIMHGKETPGQIFARVSPCAESTISTQSLGLYTNEKQMLKNTSHKWKMITNQDEEKSFRVHAMVWWERDNEKSPLGDMGNVPEDLLIAVIEYMPNESDDTFEREFYLVCWSRRRLGFGEDQLLEDIGSQSNNLADRKGIRLPNDLYPDSIAILTEPQNQNDYDRAIILVSSTPVYSGDEPAYAAFQLQASNTSRVSSEENTIPQTHVIGKLSSHGYVPCLSDSSAIASCSSSGIFLAGGSFNFDHSTEPDDHLKEHTNEYIATLGVIKTDGGGLDSVVIGSSGPSHSGSVLLNNCRAFMSGESTVLNEETPLRGVVKYWISDVVKMKRPFSIDQAKCDEIRYSFYEYFVWTIALNDGSIFTWSAPFFVYKEGSCPLNIDTQFVSKTLKEKFKNENFEDSKKEEDQPGHLDVQLDLLLDSKSSLQLPSMVSPRIIFSYDGRTILCNGSDIPQSLFLGFSSCILGDSSLWMNGIATTSMSEIAIGPLPFSVHGCILYSGQRCRQLQQHIPGIGGSNGINLLVELFGLSDCTVSAPSFTPSLLSSVIDESSLLISKHDTERSLLLPDPIIIRQHIKMLFEKEHDESIITSLKVLILRSSEYLADVSSSLESAIATQMNLDSVNLTTQFAKCILCTITSIAKDSLSPVEFASLFLGLGRQIEPHQFDVLFPLLVKSPFKELLSNSFESNSLLNTSIPLTPNQDSGHHEVTVEDLFQISMKSGSIWIAASALPIFVSNFNSHLQCLNLLKSCLDVIGNSKVFSNIKFTMNSEEEKHVIQQLYLFGLKLEDADEDNIDYDSASNYSQSDIHSTADSSYYDSECSSYRSEEDNLDEMSFVSSSSAGENFEEKENNENEIPIAENNVGENSKSPDDSFVNVTEQSAVPIPEKVESVSVSGIAKLKNYLSPRRWKSRNEPEEEKFPEIAIQSAASSFILSGFELPTDNDEIKSPPPPHINMEHSEPPLQTHVPRKSKSCISTNGSVSGAIGKYFTTMAFSSDEYCLSGPRRWKVLSEMAQILTKERGDRSFMEGNKFDLTRIMNNALEDLDAAKHLFSFEGNEAKESLTNDGPIDDDNLSSGKSFCVKYITECMQEMDDPVIVDSIFTLTLLLLLQHDSCKEVENIRTSLALLAIVSGHVSGSLFNLLGESFEDTAIGRCYSLAAREVTHVC